jgi:hypothetical protein
MEVDLGKGCSMVADIFQISLLVIILAQESLAPEKTINFV